MNSYRLEDLEVYRLALAFANRVWAIVVSWDKFCRFHPGSQWAAAADSISANIAEGYGRYHFKDRINFYYFARGSILETKDWIYKAHARELIDAPTHDSLMGELAVIFGKLNGFIRHQRNNLK